MELAMEMLRDIYEPHEAAEWALSAQPALNGSKPCELVLTHDGWGRLFNHCKAIRDGVFV